MPKSAIDHLSAQQSQHDDAGRAKNAGAHVVVTRKLEFLPLNIYRQTISNHDDGNELGSLPRTNRPIKIGLHSH